MTSLPRLAIRWTPHAALTALLLLAVWALFGSAPAAPAALAQTGGMAALEAHVLDSATGLPIAGARASAPALGLQSTTDGAGRFRWIVALSEPARPITVTVSAPGYGDWTIQDVLLVRDDTLRLEARLGPEPVTILVPSLDERPEPPALPESLALGGASPMDQMSLPLPATIRVRVTGYPYCDTSRPYTVQTIDFMDYVKHVLPSEWVPSWPWESLRAGAMAAKMYAWSIIAAGGRYPDADVYDSTCDQVYNPAVSYASTDASVEYTWNWRQTRSGNLVRTYYRAYYSQCVAAGLAGSCMGQWDSRDLAYDLYTWDEILLYFYPGSVFTPVWDPPGGYSLRFYGNGYGDLDRVKIALDAPARPVDVGATDFTLEWWMKANAADNPSPACTPGADTWIYGNILFDRDVYGPGDYGDFGVSLAGGVIAFGTSNGTSAFTLCGTRTVADGQWHHVAVTRRLSDGTLSIYVDGVLDAQADGPDGDISYRDGRATAYANDPYLVIGAEKFDLDRALYPAFSGWIDEVRLSRTLRYTADFNVPSAPFLTDANTLALFHFNEGTGDMVKDVSGYGGGPSNGLRRFGGSPAGPEWSTDSPFALTPTPTATPTATQTTTTTPTATTAPAPTATPTLSPTPTQTPEPSPSPTPTSDTATPTSTSPHPADINRDGRVDVLDVQLCVNVFLGTVSDPEIAARADVNADGAVNVLDVQTVVNVFLGG